MDKLLRAIGTSFSAKVPCTGYPAPRAIPAHCCHLFRNQPKNGNFQTEIGGNFAPNSLATLDRIEWQLCSEIRTLVGLSLIVTHLAWFYSVVRVIGGCYLLYLGINLCRTAKHEIPGPSDGGPSSSWSAYWLGLLTTMTNPKAAIFFGGVFAAVLPAVIPAWVKVVTIGLIVFDSTVFHVSLALFFSTRAVKILYRKVKRHVDRLAGVALGILGLRLIVGNR